MAPKDPTWTPLPTTPPPLPRPPRTANTRPSRPLQWATMVGLCNDPAPSTGCLTWYGIRSATRLYCHHRISNYCPVFYQNIYVVVTYIILLLQGYLSRKAVFKLCQNISKLLSSPHLIHIRGYHSCHPVLSLSPTQTHVRIVKPAPLPCKTLSVEEKVSVSLAQTHSNRQSSSSGSMWRNYCTMLLSSRGGTVTS